MAKKTTKKASKKIAKKTSAKGAKTAKKGTAKRAGKTAGKVAGKAAGKRAGKGGASLAPKPVKTGRGPTPAEIGQDFVDMFNRGQYKEIEEKYWSPQVTSIEGVGVSLAWRGRKAVLAKNNEWVAQHTIRSATAEGPYVGATGFAMKMRMEVEKKEDGSRVLMEEVGVYTVQNGKVVQEEFMYGSMTPIAPATGGEVEVEVERVETPEAVEAMGAF